MAIAYYFTYTVVQYHVLGGTQPRRCLSSRLLAGSSSSSRASGCLTNAFSPALPAPVLSLAQTLSPRLLLGVVSLHLNPDWVGRRSYCCPSFWCRYAQRRHRFRPWALSPSLLEVLGRPRARSGNPCRQMSAHGYCCIALHQPQPRSHWRR